MIFYWSLSDSKFPQVSRTRLRNLAVLSNAVIWIDSSKKSSANTDLKNAKGANNNNNNNNNSNNNNNKIVDIIVPADHRIKLKECEKKDKFLDLARELKKLWNMQVTIIPNCNWCVWNSN